VHQAWSAGLRLASGAELALLSLEELVYDCAVGRSILREDGGLDAGLKLPRLKIAFAASP